MNFSSGTEQAAWHSHSMAINTMSLCRADYKDMPSRCNSRTLEREVQ